MLTYREAAQEVALQLLMQSPYWAKNTSCEGLLIEGLICPRCRAHRGWTPTLLPLFIQCSSKKCGAHTPISRLFPNLKERIERFYRECANEQAS